MKYIAKFENFIKASDILNEKEFNFSEASAEQLRRFVPEFDYSKSSDLMGLAFDVAVANAFNKNGDGICSMGAIKMKQSLSNKPINIEHNREMIVGHTLSSYFTEIDSKEEIDEEYIKQSKEKFNITIGGVLYKIVAKEMANILEEIKAGYKKDYIIASSWEVGFDSFYASIGGDNLEESYIIKDQNEINKLTKYMRSFGGSGVNEQGQKVNRLINPDGEIVFLGVGLTKYPAANVGQIYSLDYKDKENEESISSEDNNKKISHFKNENVIDNISEEIMNKEDIIKLIEEVVASDNQSKISQESIANTTCKIADAIIESNKVFVENKEKAEIALQEAEAVKKEQSLKLEELEKKINESSLELEEARKKIESFESAAKEEAEKAAFNERMSDMDDKFVLNDEDREIIAKQISSLASDEEYQEFAKNMQVLMAEKIKSKIEETKKMQEDLIDKAVQNKLKEIGVSDPLEAKATEIENKEVEIPNNSAESSEKELSFREKFSKAFQKQNIKVTI